MRRGTGRGRKGGRMGNGEGRADCEGGGLRTDINGVGRE